MKILPFKNKAYLFRSASANAGKFWHNSSRIRLSLNFTANCISLTRPSLLSLSQSYPRGVLLTLPLSQTNVFDTVFPAATGEGDLDLSPSLEDSAMVRCLIKDVPKRIYSVSHYTRRWRTMGALNFLACVCAQAMKFPAYFYWWLLKFFIRTKCIIVMRKNLFGPMKYLIWLTKFVFGGLDCLHSVEYLFPSEFFFSRGKETAEVKDIRERTEKWMR